MDWRMDTWSLSRWVSPFRNLRINGYLLLPEAYRSLSRLSSALSAKASTIRSFMNDQLDLKDGFFQVHTCIALHALVFGQFFALFSSKCVIIFRWCLGCLDISSISYMRFSRYIADNQSPAYPMENTRFELVTSCLQGRRSPNWANPPYLVNTFSGKRA